jgi:glucan phosphoethanolaminetransferase (alkaline phosphatase superfamily)
VAKNKNKNILFAVILIFILTLAGYGISVLVSSRIPLWLLLGVSVIYSIEKWFNYYMRKYKIAGKIYRLVLNLSLVSLLGLLIWSSFSLFNQQFMQSPLVGSLVFLLELAIFIWSCRVISKNSWRQPSMKLTILSLLCLFLIFSFAGVQPMASYKDGLIDRTTNFVNEQKLKAEERRVEEENRRAVEKAAMDAAGVVGEYGFYKDYVVLFNEFRSENGRQPLVFDSTLNELATKRALEISQPGNFSHKGIERYNLGENIAMMAYSSDTASDLIELWASSPGHRSNMLSYSYHRTGFAKNGKYAVQIFD